MPSGYNFDPTIHKRLEISREIPQIQARHLGMEHSMLQIFPIKTSLCFLPGRACGLWRQAIVDA